MAAEDRVCIVIVRHSLRGVPLAHVKQRVWIFTDLVHGECLLFHQKDKEWIQTFPAPCVPVSVTATAMVIASVTADAALAPAPPVVVRLVRMVS